MPEQHLRVLVVEDEASLRLVVTRMLELGGHEAIACASGEEALAIVEAGQPPFDVLLSDIVLGGIDGGTVAAEVGRRRPGTPVVFMSGHEAAEIVGVLPAGAASGFLAKPYTREALVAAVEGAWHDAGRPGAASHAGREPGPG